MGCRVQSRWQVGLAGAWSRDQQKQAHVRRPTSHLQSLTWEASLKDLSVQGCARPLPKGSSSLWAQSDHLHIDYLSTRASLCGCSSSRPVARCIPSSGIFSQHCGQRVYLPWKPYHVAPLPKPSRSPQPQPNILALPQAS